MVLAKEQKWSCRGEGLLSFYFGPSPALVAATRPCASGIVERPLPVESERDTSGDTLPATRGMKGSEGAAHTGAGCICILGGPHSVGGGLLMAQGVTCLSVCEKLPGLFQSPWDPGGWAAVLMTSGRVGGKGREPGARPLSLLLVPHRKPCRKSVCVCVCLSVCVSKVSRHWTSDRGAGGDGREALLMGYPAAGRGRRLAPPQQHPGGRTGVAPPCSWAETHAGRVSGTRGGLACLSCPLRHCPGGVS